MRFSKKSIFIIAGVLIALSLATYLIYTNYINITRDDFSSDYYIDKECKIIEKGLVTYILENNDTELKNLGIESGKTNSGEILQKLKEPIIKGPYINKDFIFSIYDYGYKGFKIEVNKSSIVVKVSPQKKISECVVIIKE